MMANNDMSRWCVLYTAPKSERKLVQRLHAAGYMAFCPMQGHSLNITKLAN